MFLKSSSSSSPVRSHAGCAPAGAFRRARRAALVSLALLPAACSDAGPVDGAPADVLEGDVAEAALELALPFDIDPRKSLIVTETDVVSAFTLEDVLQQLIDQAGASVTATPLTVFRQLMNNHRPGASDPNNIGPNCDDEAPNAGDLEPVDDPPPGLPPFPPEEKNQTGSINGWPVFCPRTAADIDSDPFADAESDSAYMATTLANRFDLAPPDGAHCGEYRVVFAKRSGITNGLNRNFIIFEARLPNPNPSQGRLGCQAVVDFWLNQSDPAKSPATRAAELHDFYFDGLSGFEPVIHIDHYGPEGGQIRTNEFVRPNGLPLTSWSLRQFEIAHAGPTGGWLLIAPAFVSDNPAGKLFTNASGDQRVTDFQGTFFPSVVERLAATDDINRFAYGETVPSQYEAGESLMIPLHNNYLNKLTTAPTAFRNGIQAELTAMGSSLTPEQLVGRAQSLACAGCHEPVNVDNEFFKTKLDENGQPVPDFDDPESPLDVGLPSNPLRTLGFTHTSEQTEAVDETTSRQRFRISKMLSDVFLPFRKQVMEDFLLNHPILGFEKPGAWTSTQAQLSVHTGRVVEGISSLQILTPGTFHAVVSPNFSTLGLTIGNKITVDLFVSPAQPNPSWVGNVEVLISIPSAGINNQWAGNVPLTPLTRGSFQRIQFASLATATKNALSATPRPTDVKLQFNFNVTSNSGPYYLDNVRFEN
ncbi:hypothetical protein [Sorangium sp. So ce861]|uniref:hypothetical protein n=1 Tax=Sorangium sp. So ce861 TaxID=3133323 RepID=UPI003F627EEB